MIGGDAEFDKTRLTGLVCSVVDLASVCTPEMMAPILTNAEVQQRLLPFLPSGESLPQNAAEIQNTLNSPQFQQVGAARPGGGGRTLWSFTRLTVLL